MTLQNILNQYKNEYKTFKETGELDTNSNFYLSLFDYFLNSDDGYTFYSTIDDCTSDEYITNQLSAINVDKNVYI